MSTNFSVAVAISNMIEMLFLMLVWDSQISRRWTSVLTSFSVVLALNNEMEPPLLVVVRILESEAWISVPTGFGVAVAINNEREVLLLLVVWDSRVFEYAYQF